jgi:hypothetical protein
LSEVLPFVFVFFVLVFFVFFVFLFSSLPPQYNSDEEKSKPVVSSDPSDPQNRPLSFSAKKVTPLVYTVKLLIWFQRNKQEDFVYEYSNKRPNITETKESEPVTLPQKTGLGLASLADYASDDE